MTQIKGQNFFTINAAAGETYEVVYETTHILNIMNFSDDTIIIAERENYTVDGASEICIKLPASSYINGIAFAGKSTFITTLGTGDIGVVRVS